MTVLTRRLLPLACTLWILAVFAASPNARETSRSRQQNPHPDLSLFTHSDNCLACHNTLLSPDGEDVSIGATWRSTMMANSARDPYWQAGVRRGKHGWQEWILIDSAGGTTRKVHGKPCTGAELAL